MARIIDVLSHVNVMTDELVYREPQGGAGDFRMGSQVIVQESQAAVFVRQGQMLDVLGPGSHTLSTGNLPLLSNVIGMITNGANPFTCEVYFVNLKDMPSVTWGTNPPIYMKTPGQGPGFLLLMSRGTMTLSIQDPGRIVKQLGVGRPLLRLDDDLMMKIRTTVQESLNDLISSQNVTDLQNANRVLGQVRAGAFTLLQDPFAALGFTIKSFEATSFDTKDLTPQDLVKYGGNVDTYERIKRLDVADSAAKNPGMAGGLAGAGLGLGIGQSLGNAVNPQDQALQQQMQQQQLMMQQMMMQMMQNQQNQNQQNQPHQQATPAVNQNPQTKEEIQALLDNLDMKLASGEITQAIYDKLSAKWEERLKQLGG
jgi:membrane protease subunit (stomatin/prohibitin family)